MKQSNRIPRGLVFSVFAGKAWLWKKVWRRNLARLGSKFENVKSPRPVSRADAASSKVTHKALFSQLCDKLESDDDVARKIADKLVLMAQEFQSLSDAGSSDHDAGSSDYNAVRDDELIDP